MSTLTLTLVAWGLAPVIAGADADDSGNVWFDERRVANIAHAGGIFEAPQNTLFAFKTAGDRGADVIEMDLHATADGHVVVIHDSTVNRTTDGDGCVVGHTLEELEQLDAAHTHVPGQNPQSGLPDDTYPYRGVATGMVDPPEGFEPNDFTIPTLEEVFDALPDALMVLEIKPTQAASGHDCPAILESIPEGERPDVVAELARLIDEHDMADQVMVASFIDALMAEFVALAPHVDTSYPLGEGLALYAAFLAGDPPPNPHGHKAVQAPLEISGITVTQEVVEYARSHGIAVHFWTINDPDEMAMLLDWGADGIITDRVQVLDQLLTERGDPRPIVGGDDEVPDDEVPDEELPDGEVPDGGVPDGDATEVAPGVETGASELAPGPHPPTAQDTAAAPIRTAPGFTG